MSLCQEVGSGRLQDTAVLLAFSGKQAIGLLKVGDDLLVAVIVAGTCEVALHTSRRLQLQGHTAKELHQFEITVCTQEIAFAKTGIVVLARLIVVLRYILNNDVRLLNQSIIGVPHGSQVTLR